MARLSKISSIQNKYGDVFIRELVRSNIPGFHIVGDNLEQYETSWPWSMVKNAYILHVDTDKKTTEGFYFVKEIEGPFDAIAQASNNRLFCWNGKNIKLYDIRENKFITEFNYGYSYIISLFLSKEVGGLQQKRFQNINKIIKEGQHKFVDWLFTYEYSKFWNI